MSTYVDTLVGTPFPVSKECPTPQQVLDGAAIINPGGDMRIEPICIPAMTLDDGVLRFNMDVATLHMTDGPAGGTTRVLRDVSGTYGGPDHENNLTLY